jgi:hypothetical protein
MRPELPSDFPAQLANLAFWSGTDASWPLDRTAEVIEWLGAHGLAVLGTELWVVQANGIQSLPLGADRTRGVYGNTVNRRKDERWDAFVERSTAETLAYLDAFDPSAIAEKGSQYFNVVWVGESEFDDHEGRRKSP